MSDVNYAMHLAIETVNHLTRENVEEVESVEMRRLMDELLDLQDYKKGVEESIGVVPTISAGDLLLPQMEQQLGITQGAIMGKERELISYLYDFYLKNPSHRLILLKKNSRK